MNAAILCPGPSLARWPRETFDAYPLTIGVNRAAMAYRCRWWVWLDGSLFNHVTLDYRPRILSSAEATRQVREDHANTRLAEHDVTIVENCWDFCPPCEGWSTFSMTAAIILAAKEGATHIDVYGCDMTDAPDFDGVTLPENRRTSDRWDHERLRLGGITKWLSSRGVPVQIKKPE